MRTLNTLNRNTKLNHTISEIPPCAQTIKNKCPFRRNWTRILRIASDRCNNNKTRKGKPALENIFVETDLATNTKINFSKAKC